MPRLPILLKRSLIFAHRWLGVLLAVLFMLWFASGIVMMYWSFPGVSARDRRQRAPVLNPTGIRISPQDAYARMNLDQLPAAVQLISFDGRPVYRFSTGGGVQRGRRSGEGGAIVYADDGTIQKGVDDAMIDRAAAAWAGRALSVAKKQPVEEVDQWTVGSNLRTLRPLYKYSFDDGQQVYVSGRNAEVVQYTTSESRFCAYLGAIPHWLYFTPLRKHQPQWFGFVVWTSGIGSIAALLGIVVGVWMLSPAGRFRYQGAPTSIPYRGWKRWHMIIGLCFGLMALTWAFSGLLSMGPFEVVDRMSGNADRGKGQEAGAPRGLNIAEALRGPGLLDLAEFTALPPQTALAALAKSSSGSFQARELELSMFAGAPIYIATDAAGRSRVIPVGGKPAQELERSRIMSIIREAAGPDLAELAVIDQYDAYYLDRQREKPLPVIYARMSAPSDTRYYIDPKTARVVGSYSARNWVNRWLYHGLHSLDFPWLYNYRPLWDIVVISLMLGGTALCATSLVLAWRVVSRKLSMLFLSCTKYSAELEEDLTARS